jgi:hypothetical protein
MILRLRRTNLAPAYQDWVHYIVYEDDKDVGRIYEDRAAPPEQQWSWLLTVEVNPHGIVTSGKTGTAAPPTWPLKRLAWRGARLRRLRPLSMPPRPNRKSSASCLTTWIEAEASMACSGG